MSDLVIGDVGIQILSATTGASKAGEDLIHETQRHLYSGAKEGFNRLSGNHNNSTGTFTFKDALDGIQRGSVLAVNLELLLVISMNEQNKTATVKRGWLGSEPASHSDDAFVHVDAKFSPFAIFQALNDELNALTAEGLYQMKTIDVTYSSAVRGYDLAGVTDILSIYELRWETTGSSKYWPEIRNFTISRDMAAGEFASKIALFLHEGASAGQTIRVRYKAPFGQLTSLTDNVQTVAGLHYQAHDILPFGAAARLVAPREVKRGFMESQGHPRRAEEVPPGSQLRSAQGLLTLRNLRVNQERARLDNLYPPKVR